MDALQQWGLTVILALQQSLPGLPGVMRAFTFLGQEEFFLFVMPALYWCVQTDLGARLVVMIVLSNGLNGPLKLAFALPRPYWVDARVTAFAAEPNYGLPSGHAMNAVAVWGWLAAQLKRPWAWAAAVVIVALISLSRVYLGVHFPTDIFSGWLFGVIVLGAFLAGEKPLTASLKRLNLWMQIALAFAVSMLYLALTVGLLAAVPAPAALADWERTAAQAQAAPPDAGERAIDPRGLADHVTAAGLLFGVGAGLALMSRGARFEAGGPLGQRVARFVLGVAGIAVVFFGLRLLAAGDDAIGYLIRYLRYALAVVWALYVAPLIFLRAGLAQPRSE